MDKEFLEIGAIYLVKCSKFNVAIWTGKDFKGPSLVNGKTEFDTANHYSEGLPKGTCTPIEVLSKDGLPTKTPFDGGNLLAAMCALDYYVYWADQRRDEAIEEALWDERGIERD